jgi:hypothetical protein
MLRLCEESLKLYVDAAAGEGMTTDTLRVETAKHQGLLNKQSWVLVLRKIMSYERYV